MNRNTDGWIAVSEGPTGVWLFVGEENAVPADLPTYPDAGTGSIALHNGSNEVYLYHEEDGWKEFKLGGVSPEGTLLIVANGTYDVRDKASVSVNVQAVSDEDAVIEKSINGEYSNSKAVSVGEYIFSENKGMTKASLQNALDIGSSSFQNCQHLVEVDIEKATRIGSYAFSGCTELETVHTDAATYLGSRAFYGCTKLEEINTSRVESIGELCFGNCKALAEIDLSACTSISGNAFQGCSALRTVTIPLIGQVSSSAFNGCTSLTKAEFPSAYSIGSNACVYCSSLTRVDIGGSYSESATGNIQAGAFRECSSLTALVIKETRNTFSLLGTSAFDNTPIASGTGFIYVPDALVDSYKAATNWSTYAAQIKGLSELPA